MKAAGGTQALERGLAVLEAIAEAPANGVRLSDVAERCGLEPPTAHRLVAALERYGFVGRVGDSKRLGLGPKLFQLASLSEDQGGLVAAARPGLVRLASYSGDCMFLMARSGFDAVCLDRQDGEYTIRSLTGHIGGATPLGLGPGSTTILAHLPKDEREAILAANRRRIEALGHALPSEDDLARIREHGYCHEISRSIAGIVGAAVPILTPKGRPIAALAIGATEARLPEPRLAAVIARMREEASLLSLAIANSRTAMRS
ncbi:IclR family transcriptional regulator [Chelatococcus sp. GCM10030263]|uniref:IclR family transcriptional regulator n=1 Tax=Chelatococcus sp. GCM10030263 TaxID=3273387 RepID=UPI00361322E6